MYRQGRRFAEAPSAKVPAFEIAAMQARSYLAAINALSLVDKRNAWVSGAPAPLRALRVGIIPLSPAWADHHDRAHRAPNVAEYLPTSRKTSFRNSRDPSRSSSYPTSRRSIPSSCHSCNSLAVFVICTSSVSVFLTSLSKLMQVISGISVSPHEVVGLFTQRGMFDHAQSAAASLQVDMTDMFHSLAARCVELSRMSDIGG